VVGGNREVGLEGVLGLKLGSELCGRRSDDVVPEAEFWALCSESCGRSSLLGSIDAFEEVSHRLGCVVTVLALAR
jgi:hypothetical protein